jgi:dTDP-4-dehydrorhamnose reductase
MKILVIGAMGQLGHEIMQLSNESEHEFIFTDVRGDGEKILPLDMTDEKQVFDIITEDVDVVINCAAYNEVDKAEDDEQTALELNEKAVLLVAKACAKADAHLFHFSTDYVFDGKGNTPYTEDDCPKPVSAYGKSKLAGEKAVQESGCKYMIFRTSWLYSLTGRNFFKTIATKCASSSSIKVVIDQIGTPTHAYDLAFLVLHIIESGKLDKTGLYHYSNEGTASWYDFAKEINDMLGYTCNVEPCRTSEFPVKAMRPCYSVMDKKKVKETFGIEIPHWRESLAMLVEEYETNGL